jgi:hypothetical protein
MGAWADIIKVLRSTIFKNELKNGDYSVKHATSAGKLSALSSAVNNVFRHVWFSDDGDSGLPRKDDAFKYNPSTKQLTINGHNVATISKVSAQINARKGVEAVLGAIPKGKTINNVVAVAINNGNYLRGSGLVYNITGTNAFCDVLASYVGDQTLVLNQASIKLTQKTSSSGVKSVAAIITDFAVSALGTKSITTTAYDGGATIDSALTVTVYFN